MNARGMTLIEVLVALTLLGVGAAALAGWQLGIVRLAAQSRQQHAVNRVLEEEVTRRQLTRDLSADCQAAADKVTCRVTYESCLVSSLALVCGAGSGWPRRVTVLAAVSGGDERSVSFLLRSAP